MVKQKHLKPTNQYNTNMTSIVFVVTGAHIIPDSSPILLRERYIEYRIALQKISLYKQPIFGVLSEFQPQSPEIPPFDDLCNAGLLKLPSPFLSSCTTKSQREFLSIQYLIQDMNLPNDTFIIKVSGRYILMNDTFYNTVESVKDNPEIDGVACLTKDKQNQYTFLFALRWKWFKKFYSKYVMDLGQKNVEQFILEFYKEENIMNKIKIVDELGIFTQICNAKQFQML